MKNKTLILLTDSYPFGRKEPYIEKEIDYLSKAFKRIIVISSETNPETELRLPPNLTGINFVLSLSFIDKIRGFKYLFSNMFWVEMKMIRNVFMLKINFLILKTIFDALVSSEIYAAKIASVLNEYNIKHSELILYSFWNDYRALAIARIKKRVPMLTAISRAHGSDVYFERHPYNYLPMKKHIIDSLDAVFCISENGKKYLENKLRLDGKNDKLQCSRLGTREIAAFNIEKKRASMLMVSCSGIIFIKRINLIIKALASIKDYSIEWIHIGVDGDDHNIKSLANNLLGEKYNISYKFLGGIPNEEVLEFYKCNNIDIFINLSETEGIPASIMEAMAAGIPVIATNVGGVSEIVNDQNGILLNANTDVGQIKSEIDRFYYMDEVKFNSYRKNAFNTWKEYYNAEKNYKVFVEKILNL